MSKKQTSKDMWNNNASYWSENISNENDLTRSLFGLPAFLDFMKASLKKGKILDLGCGDGSISRLIGQDKNLQITAIDFSSEMIKLAKKHPCQHGNIAYIEASLEEPAEIFTNPIYDLAFSYMAINCCINLNIVLKNIYGTLRDSADFFIALPHPCFTTSQTTWEKDADGKIQGLLINSYFETKPQTRKWDFSKNIKNKDSLKMEEIRSYWTLSELLNELISSNFNIVEVLEPRPPQDAIEQNPRLKRWSEDAACFLFVHCKK